MSKHITWRRSLIITDMILSLIFLALPMIQEAREAARVSR